jgi:hypothetical protein
VHRHHAGIPLQLPWLLAYVRLLLLVDFGTHLRPHVQVIINLMLAEGLIYLWTLLVNLAVVNIFAMVE